MHADYQAKDALHANLTIRIEKADYEPKYRLALQDYKKKASFKGFRKGKTPVGYLEKLFGQEVLTRTVTDLLMDSVNKYLEEQKIRYIGQPLPADTQQPLHFDPKDLQDAYTYEFELGLLPDFEIKGLDQEMVWHDIQVSDAEVEKEWEEILKRGGSYVDTKIIDAESRVTFRFREMEGLGPKPDGREHTRAILLSAINDEISSQLIGKEVGEIVRFDPDKFLKQGDLQFFRRYYMDMKEDNEVLSDQVEAQVIDIAKLQPAEVNKELLDRTFGEGAVEDEVAAKKFIAEVLKSRHDAKSDSHLRHMMEHQLMDANQFDLPMDFIEKLIKATQDKAQDSSSPEKRAASFRWHFIKERLQREYNITVSEEQIIEAAGNMIYDRFGSYLPYDRMQEMVERYLRDRDTVDYLRNSIADNMLFRQLKEVIPQVKKEISLEEFQALQEEHKHEH